MPGSPAQPLQLQPLQLAALPVMAYQLDYLAVPVAEDDYEILIDVRLERCLRGDGGAAWWAIRERGACLTKAGAWEREPNPSSRDDAFYARCRFATAEEALAFWQAGNHAGLRRARLERVLAEFSAPVASGPGAQAAGQATPAAQAAAETGVGTSATTKAAG